MAGREWFKSFITPGRLGRAKQNRCCRSLTGIGWKQSVHGDLVGIWGPRLSSV